MPKKIVMCWSCGKDSAMALHRLLEDKNYHVAALFTTITADYDRVSMHGIRKDLLEKQAKHIGIPLNIMAMSKNADNNEYETAMKQCLLQYKEDNITGIAFGDLYLEGIREYREKNMAKVNMDTIFPLWGADTIKLADTFVREGFKAVTTCIDTEQLGQNFAGRELDEQFFKDLPESTNPCGEKGEYHTFVYDGPIFKKPVPFQKGEKVLRDNRFYFCDLI